MRNIITLVCSECESKNYYTTREETARTKEKNRIKKNFVPNAEIILYTKKVNELNNIIDKRKNIR